MANQESTIIVGIPAINDPDLTETVRHALGLRSRGHKLKLIVVEQTSRHGEDLASIVSEYKGCELAYRWTPEPLGAWPARQLIATMAAVPSPAPPNLYYLSIDSHTRFVYGWDDTLITLHNAGLAAPVWLDEVMDNVVITGGMPTSLWGKDLDMIPVATYDYWDESGLPRGTSHLHSVIGSRHFVPARQYLASSSFGPADLAGLYLLHNGLFFCGEEHVIGLEVWRKRWAMYHTHLPLTHLSLRPEDRPWQTQGDEWWAKSDVAVGQVRRIMHGDMGSCDERCRWRDDSYYEDSELAAAVRRRYACSVEYYQSLIGVDYRARREVKDSPWHQRLADMYPNGPLTKPEDMHRGGRR